MLVDLYFLVNRFELILKVNHNDFVALYSIGKYSEGLSVLIRVESEFQPIRRHDHLDVHINRACSCQLPP